MRRAEGARRAAHWREQPPWVHVGGGTGGGGGVLVIKVALVALVAHGACAHVYETIKARHKGPRRAAHWRQPPRNPEIKHHAPAPRPPLPPAPTSHHRHHHHKRFPSGWVGECVDGWMGAVGSVVAAVPTLIAARQSVPPATEKTNRKEQRYHATLTTSITSRARQHWDQKNWLCGRYASDIATTKHHTRPLPPTPRQLQRDTLLPSRRRRGLLPAAACAACAACCCLPLPAAACRCLLLPAVACCCLLLPAAA